MKNMVVVCTRLFENINFEEKVLEETWFLLIIV